MPNRHVSETSSTVKSVDYGSRAIRVCTTVSLASFLSPSGRQSEIDWMSENDKVAGRGTRYELRFSSLLNGGREFAFPCDLEGHVDFGNLSERTRSNYFYARTVIGRELSVPFVSSVE